MSDVKVFSKTGNFRYAPTGEEYMILCGEGGTRIKAWQDYAQNLRRMIRKSKGGTLFWRHRPICMDLSSVNQPNSFYRVYSRLLISNKSIIQSHDINEQKA